MSRRDEKFLAYLAQAQKTLGLTSWTIRRSEHTPADKDTAAEIEFTPARHDAAMRIGPTFWAATAEEQRYLTAHELVHVHLRRVNDVMESVEDVLGPAAYSILLKAYNNANEFATDALATVLADLLPLPRFPK